MTTPHTWLDSRAKLTYTTRGDQNFPYGVALHRPEHGDWIPADWGLSIEMAYRFLKLLHSRPEFHWREYAPEIPQENESNEK